MAHLGNPGQNPESHKTVVCVRACVHGITQGKAVQVEAAMITS